MRIMKRVKGGSEGGEGFNDVLLRRDALDATCMKYRCCFFFTCLYFTEIQGVLNMAMGSKPLRGIKKRKRVLKQTGTFYDDKEERKTGFLLATKKKRPMKLVVVVILED